MRVLTLLAVGIAIIAGACSSTNTTSPTAAPGESAQTGTYQTMSIDELADVMADTNRAYTVVNVHIPYEGEIEGTDYNIAYNNVDALTSALPDKNAPIILYCRSGNMSEQATRDLVELGYTQVYDVPGGMGAWQSSGRTIVDNQ
ncbi:MAG: rhodanese-like domain-containing protein [Anaerolineae bacterium]|nr:rhodanese-like domain-containing protein [Anaerolineae bacterium]